jgi:hypothetical protein
VRQYMRNTAPYKTKNTQQCTRATVLRSTKCRAVHHTMRKRHRTPCQAECMACGALRCTCGRELGAGTCMHLADSVRAW